MNNINKFDATFFGIHSKLADKMDPTSRMLLEHAYEAIIDSGLNPQQIRGSRTGVFIALTSPESENKWFIDESVIVYVFNSIYFL